MKIAIVGGGLAGISTAYRLLEDSRIAQVHLFEASGRYGGRAHTDCTSIPGFAFDMGAQYIQDPDINPLTGIARRLGFKTIEEDSDALLRVQASDGSWKNEPVTEPSVQEAVKAIRASYKAAREHPNVIVAGKPRVDSAAEAFGHATSPYGPFTESAETWQYIAADRDREKAGSGQKNLFVERGIGTLVSTYGSGLFQTHPDRYVEHLNTTVTDIAHDEQHVRLTFGNQYVDVDACVVTVPVSVLQDGGIRFVPALPVEHKEALKSLRLGSYKKIALRLRKPPDSIAAGMNYYLLHEAQAHGDPEGVWQYYRLPHALDVLVAHAAGNFAHALDAVTDREVYNLFKNDIQEACDGVFFTTGKAITNWSRQPGVRGAYSYTAFNGGGPDDPRSLQARVALARPVGRVYFAGEASNLDYYGTLQAAFFEGRRAAEDILAGH